LKGWVPRKSQVIGLLARFDRNEFISPRGAGKEFYQHKKNLEI
jgi:hypothetical protein